VVLAGFDAPAPPSMGVAPLNVHRIYEHSCVYWEKLQEHQEDG
jgi:hypothetical protein